MGLLATLKREFTYVTSLRRINKWVQDLSAESPQLLPDDFEAVCDTHGARPAIIFEGKEWSYNQLDGKANRYAHWGVSIGLKAGDVVALFMQNRPDYIAAWYGLSKIGVVIALINHNLQGPALLHCVTVAKSKAVIVGFEIIDLWASIEGQTGDIAVWVGGGNYAGAGDLDRSLNAQPSARPSRAHREALRGKDPCLYVYTSGTTGNPKAATLSHMRVQGMSRSFIGATRTNERDRVYIPLPLYHGTGGICGVGICLNTGAAMVLRRKFSATGFWDDIVDNQCTIFVYIGELFRYLISAPVHPKERLHKIKSCFGNGLRLDVWTRAEERFGIRHIAEFYGSTEGNVSFINVDGKLGAVGRIPKYAKKRFNSELVRFDIETEQPIRGADGLCELCAPDEVGEAIGKITTDTARGRFEGYANDKAATDKKLLRDVFEPGDLWFRTGDLLKQDSDGYFYFVDRIGDTYRWKSENVSTNEVSEAIGIFDGIEQANVYGVDVPHTDGRAGMAVIVAHGPVDMAALSSHLRTQLPSYAVPVFLRFKSEVEVTGTFKYRKVELVAEGFDPSTISDPMYWMNAQSRQYEPLTPAVYAQLQDGGLRL
jgi:fatty-acyl-CoA synthase